MHYQQAEKTFLETHELGIKDGFLAVRSPETGTWISDSKPVIARFLKRYLSEQHLSYEWNVTLPVDFHSWLIINAPALPPDTVVHKHPPIRLEAKK